MYFRERIRLVLALAVFMTVPVDIFTTGVSMSVRAGNTAVLLCERDRGQTVIMVTWKVYRLDNSTCSLSLIAENQTYGNICSDRMKQENMSLTIDNTALTDEGNYTCEIVSSYGTFISTVILDVLVQPSLTLRLNRDGSPECQALSGKPAANISWIPASEGSITTHLTMNPDRTRTVISTHSVKSNNVTTVTCVVSHPTFVHRQNISIAVTNYNVSSTTIVQWVLISIASVVFISMIVGVLFFWERSHFRTCSSMAMKSTAVIQAQSIHQEGEIEPYQSYVQKTNTIYYTAHET